MTQATASTGFLASRRRLFSALAATSVGDATAMRRPGKPATVDLQPPDAPGAIMAPPSEVRWLQKASFGFSTASHAALIALGANENARWNAWVDQQLNPGALDDSDCNNRIAAAGYTTLGKSLPQLWAGHVRNEPDYFTRMLPVNETECATVIRAIYSKRQLFERTVNFWHDHFSVFGRDYDIAPIFVHYDRDVIRAHAFGNFRTMLEAVATSTAMQLYLDNYASRGADFNENYARELIELHTLGVANYFGPTDPFEVPCLQTDIHCPETMPAGYVDNDVYEAAAALTGWTIKNGDWRYPNDNDGTFVYRADWHDRRNKIFLGHYIPPNNQPAMQDGRTVFDRLVQHPGTARHVATKLCRRFIGDAPAPAPALIDAVTADFRNHIDAPDQIARMVRTILLSDAFKQDWGGGMRRPFEVTMSGLRGLEANFTPKPDNTNDWTTAEEFIGLLERTGHRPFSWSPPNGYPDRQSAWASTGALAMTLKILAKLPEMKVDRNVSTSPFVASILDQTMAALPTAPGRTSNAIINYWCDRLHGHRPEPTRTVVVNFLRQNAGPDDAIDITKNDWKAGDLKQHYTQERLRTAVGMLLMSPDYFRR